LWRLRERLDRKLVALRASFPLEWSPAYSVKVDILDSQHKQEFALIEETIKQCRESGGKGDSAGLLDVVDKLVQVTQEHFMTENSLMETHGYPQYRDHRDEHERILETLLSLRSKAGNTELVDFFKDWILRHTLLTDRQYMEFFAAKGVR
jgi:hemerythrin